MNGTLLKNGCKQLNFSVRKTTKFVYFIIVMLQSGLYTLIVPFIQTQSNQFYLLKERTEYLSVSVFRSYSVGSTYGVSK